MKKFLQDQMLWGDNFFMKSKFVSLFQNYNLGSRLQEFLHFVKSASYVYLT